MPAKIRVMAGPTRLELATSGVTGRRSNQLNYDPAKSPDQSDQSLQSSLFPYENLVGGTGFEPVTPGL